MKSIFRRIAVAAMAATVAVGAWAQKPDNTIRDGGEYLLYNCYYGRVLGGDAANTSPALSVNGTNAADTYVFVAEASTLHDGYFWLKQKSSGKYLQASNAEGDTWSVWLAGSLNPSYNSFEWKLGAGVNGTIISNRGEQINSAGNAWLAPDPKHESETYVSVYYDKPLCDRAMWQIVDANFPLDQSRYALYVDELTAAIAQGEEVMNNSVYGSQADKEELAIALYNARTALEQASSLADAQVMATATEALLAAIENVLEKCTDIWAAGSSFAVNGSYTVAIGGVQLIGEDDAVAQIAIRNKSAKGLLAILDASGLKIGEKQLAFNGKEKHDLHFAVSGDKADVYVDGTLAASVEVGAVPTVSAAGQSSEWSVTGIGNLKAYRPEIISLTAALTPDDDIPLNAKGKAELKAIKLVGQELQLNGSIDYHVLSPEAMDADSKITINGEDAWVIFDNVRPSAVATGYLPNVTVDGAAAALGENCRVEIFLQGAALIPHPSDYQAFRGYSSKSRTGHEIFLGLGNNNELGENANALRSFVLKRGYMVTLATNADGSGYSRVYVADHADKTVNSLPDLLDRRVSFIYVRPWRYVSKKGWCSTGKDEEIDYQGQLLGATWFYSWSADRLGSLDMEFIPMKCHRYWPGWEQFDKLNSTAALLLNEPEHAEQHTSDRCSCGGTTDPWTSCTMNPELFHTGMRIGGPSPTDASYLTQYVNHCNDMAYRVDFVGYHAYWGTYEASDANAWRSRLKSIYDNTKRPVWLTEWNNGASWTKEPWPSSWNDKLDYQRRKVKEVIEMLDAADFIERYAIFNLSEDQRKVLKWDSDKGDWWVTPAGEAYHDHFSTHAYQEKMQFEPVGWFPGKKDIDVAIAFNEQDRTISVTYTNPNGDYSASEVLEYADEAGNFQPLYTTPRYKLDVTDKRTEVIPISEMPYEAFISSRLKYRLKVTTLKNEVIYSANKAVAVPESIRTGIGDAEDDGALKVIAEGGRITVISAEPCMVPVYNAAGQKVADLNAAPQASINVAPGIYIVLDRKVLVK